MITRTRGEQLLAHSPRLGRLDLLVQQHLAPRAQGRGHGGAAPCPAGAHADDEGEEGEDVDGQGHGGGQHLGHLGGGQGELAEADEEGAWTCDEPEERSGAEDIERYGGISPTSGVFIARP